MRSWRGRRSSEGRNPLFLRSVFRREEGGLPRTTFEEETGRLEERMSLLSPGFMSAWKTTSVSIATLQSRREKEKR